MRRNGGCQTHPRAVWPILLLSAGPRLLALPHKPFGRSVPRVRLREEARRSGLMKPLRLPLGMAFDMRSIQLAHEAGAPPHLYGFTSQTGTGAVVRAPNGQFVVTLTDAGLSSPHAAVNTIAHELNHIREILKQGPGHFIKDEGAANLAGDLAELFYR